MQDVSTRKGQLTWFEYKQHFSTTPMHRRTDANLHPTERQPTKANKPSFDLEGGAQGKSDYIRRFPAHDFL